MNEYELGSEVLTGAGYMALSIALGVVSVMLYNAIRAYLTGKINEWNMEDKIGG